jgi:ABC-type branched-subunit amino acid transport system ATPase component
MALRRGVIHGLVGSNGSGKTTVLNLITGLYSVDAGRIVFDGQDLTRMRSYQIARLGIRRTFQTPMLVPGLTVLDNVLLGYEQNDGNGVFGSVVRSPRGRRADAKARSVAFTALGEVGLAEVAARSASELTHGQRRLAELTRVMVSDPSVVLLDEPAAGLSVGELERLRRVLEIMCGRGIGVLLVEHNVPFVLGMADEVTVLHEGSVIAHGPPKAIETHPDVIESFLGRLGAEASMKLADT